MNDLPDLPVRGEAALPSATDGMLTVAVQRSIAEVQASLIIAKRFPRNPAESIKRIQAACGDLRLAEDAEYEYSRGGSDITGPTIRLAEVVAQNWGNIDFGIKEIEQRRDGSTVSAFAWDKETNTRSELSFEVKHIRHTRNGSYDLEDPRDIYENVANLGARRLRARIMAVVPRHVFDAAVDACRMTLQEKAPVTEKLVQEMVEAFSKRGVTKAMLEKYLGRACTAESISSGHVARLRRINAAIRDGIGKVEDFFKAEAPSETKPQPTPKSGTEAIRRAVARPEAKPAPEPVQQEITPPEPAQAEDEVQETMPPADFQDQQAKAKRQSIAMRLRALGLTTDDARHAFLKESFQYENGLTGIDPEGLKLLADYLKSKDGVEEVMAFVKKQGAQHDDSTK